MALKASLLLDYKRALYDLLWAAPELEGVQVLKRYPEGDPSTLQAESLSFGGLRSTQHVAGIGPGKPRDELPAVGILVRVQVGGPSNVVGDDDAGDLAETRLFEILDQLATALHNAGSVDSPTRLQLPIANLGIRDIDQGTDGTEFGAIAYARAQVVAGIARLR